jgi:uncharacterized integral membrane protein
MLLKTLRLLSAVVFGAVLIAISVANRKPVPLVLDPFKPDAPAVQLDLPLYVYLIGALTAGVMLGGLATWVTQGRWRRQSRHNTTEALRWRNEADRLARERDSLIAGSGRLLLDDSRDAA